MFDKETFLTQEFDEDTCGDPKCCHPAISHGRPFGANSSVKCYEERCRCSHRNFIPKPIVAPAPTVTEFDELDHRRSHNHHGHKNRPPVRSVRFGLRRSA